MDNYVDFDEAGIVEIRCMNCNTPVAQRSYVEVHSKIEVNKTVKVLKLKKLSNHRQVKLNIDIDGRKSYIEPIVCADCSSKELDADKIVKKAKDGIVYEAQQRGKSQSIIDKISADNDKMKADGKVNRRD